MRGIISSQLHGLFDVMALPIMIGITKWMSRNKKRGTAIIAGTTAIEGTAFLLTDYRPGISKVMSFENHRRAGLAVPTVMALATLADRKMDRREKGLILALLAIPLVINQLSERGVK